MPRCVVRIRRCVCVQIFQLTVVRVSHRRKRVQLRSAPTSCVSENSAAPDVVTRHITTRSPALAEESKHGRKYLHFLPDKERHSVVFDSWFKSCAADLRRLHTSRGPAREAAFTEGARPKLIKYGLEDYVVNDGSKKDDGGAQGPRLKHQHMTTATAETWVMKKLPSKKKKRERKLEACK